MRGLVDIYEWSSLLVARFRRGSVVLDARSRTISELSEPAALALDVLADRADWSTDRGDAQDVFVEVRDALHTVRHELLGERTLAPGERLTIERGGGRPLLRQIAEPSRWQARRPGGGNADVLELRAMSIQTDDGVLAVVGEERRSLALARDIDDLGTRSAATDIVEIDLSEAIPSMSSSRARTRSGSAVREIWSLAAPATENLVLARLADAAALVALLEIVRARPGIVEVKALASTCVSIPHFRANVPRASATLAATLRSYGAR